MKVVRAKNTSEAPAMIVPGIQLMKQIMLNNPTDKKLNREKGTTQGGPSSPTHLNLNTDTSLKVLEELFMRAERTRRVEDKWDLVSLETT